jgi:hypothetical protein
MPADGRQTEGGPGELATPSWTTAHLDTACRHRGWQAGVRAADARRLALRSGRLEARPWDFPQRVGCVLGERCSVARGARYKDFIRPDLRRQGRPARAARDTDMKSLFSDSRSTLAACTSKQAIPGHPPSRLCGALPWPLEVLPTGPTVRGQVRFVGTQPGAPTRPHSVIAAALANRCLRSLPRSCVGLVERTADDTLGTNFSQGYTDTLIWVPGPPPGTHTSSDP